MVRNTNIFITCLFRGPDNLGYIAVPIGCDCMHVEITLDITNLNQIRQRFLLGSLNLTTVFTKKRLNIIKPQFLINFLFHRPRNHSIGLKQTVLIQLQLSLDGYFSQTHIMLF